MLWRLENGRPPNKVNAADSENDLGKYTRKEKERHLKSPLDLAKGEKKYKRHALSESSAGPLDWKDLAKGHQSKGVSTGGRETTIVCNLEGDGGGGDR